MKTTESLAALAKRWRAVAKDNTTAMCCEVVRISKKWAAYSEEARGREFNRWLLDEVDPTRHFGWYEKRAAAHTRIDETLRLQLSSRLTGEAFLWLHQQAEDDEIVAAAPALHAAYRSNRSVPLKLNQVVRLCPEFARGESIVHKLQARIARLETQIRGLGAEPVE